MRTIDRLDFLNLNFIDSKLTYSDMAHQIGYNVVISAPHMHAYALEIL